MTQEVLSGQPHGLPSKKSQERLCILGPLKVKSVYSFLPHFPIPFLSMFFIKEIGKPTRSLGSSTVLPNISWVFRKRTLQLNVHISIKNAHLLALLYFGPGRMKFWFSFTLPPWSYLICYLEWVYTLNCRSF